MKSTAPLCYVACRLQFSVNWNRYPLHMTMTFIKTIDVKCFDIHNISVKNEEFLKTNNCICELYIFCQITQNNHKTWTCTMSNSSIYNSYSSFLKVIHYCISLYSLMWSWVSNRIHMKPKTHRSIIFSKIYT